MRITIFFFLLGALLARQGHDTTPADIEAGLRYYGNYCAGCHGADGRAMQGANLSRGTFRRATTDDELIRIVINGIPGTAMPPAAFKTEQAALIVAYLRAFPSSVANSTVSGDAAKGRQIFESKGGCFECHRVNGRGSRLGPDLSDVGEVRRPADIERSLVDPGAVILPQNRIMTITTRDGKSIRGRLLNQDTQSIQILTGEIPMSIARDRIRGVTEDRAPMPSFKDKLAPQELADLVSYLASLKGIR
jgi:putative heme-binding domain-containing protein